LPAFFNYIISLLGLAINCFVRCSDDYEMWNS